MKKSPGTRTWMLVILSVLCIACAGGKKSTIYLHPGFDFSYIERVAVMPLENLSTDMQAGERATRLLITELLASGALEVVEPGELRAALMELKINTATLTSEQVVGVGRTLGVQAVITGSVTQSELIRSGQVSVPVVTLDLHMLETETGTAVWAATQTEQGSATSAKWLGAGMEPISKTTRRCVRHAVNTLIKG